MEAMMGRTMLRALKTTTAPPFVHPQRMVAGRTAARLSTSSKKAPATVSRKTTSQVPATTPTASSFLRGSPLFQRSPLSRFFEDFEKEFADPFFSPIARPFAAAADISMNLDISETDKQYVIKADLPGVKKDDVKLSFKEHVLSIVAERKEEKTDENETKHYSDFSYGKIVRHLRLPETADKESIDASMEDGVLTVKVNKSEQAEAETTIQIK